MLRYIKSLLMIVVLISLLSGCQLFKKTTSNYDTEHSDLIEAMDLIEQELYSEQQMRTLVSVKNDSTNAQTLLTIWPRGTFKFSADSGFTGMAEKIQLTTTHKTGAVQTAMETIKSTAWLQTDRKIAAKATASSSNTQKTKLSKPEAIPYLVIGMVITAIAIVLIGFLKR